MFFFFGGGGLILISHTQPDHPEPSDQYRVIDWAENGWCHLCPPPCWSCPKVLGTNSSPISKFKE